MLLSSHSKKLVLQNQLMKVGGYSLLTMEYWLMIGRRSNMQMATKHAQKNA